MRRHDRHSSFFRLFLVAAVVCGLLLQPVIAALGELHAIEHATALEGSDHHGHGADGDHGHSALTVSSDDARHGSSGLHGLMHAYAGIGAAALLDAPSFVGAGPKGSDPPQARPDPGQIALHPNSPFRPPIV